MNTIHGSNEQDILVGGDSDDVIYGGFGSDIVLGRFGSDLFVDALAADLPAGIAAPDILDYRDIYIGSVNYDLAWVPRFIERLLDYGEEFMATDTVFYSVRADDENPDTLKAAGLVLQALERTMLGDAEAVRIGLLDTNTGRYSSDHLIDIDRVRLSERRDVFFVDDVALDAPVVIDMGYFAKEAVSLADWDFVSFEDVSGGLTMVNGTSRAHGTTPPIELSLAGKFAEIANLIPYLVGQVPEILALADQVSNNPLRVFGAEHIVGTRFDDVLWFGEFGYVQSLMGQWPVDGAHPGFGEIDAGEGNDYVVYHDARYIPAGGAITPDSGGHPDAGTTAASEMRLTLKGGDGSDRVYASGGVGAIISGGEGTDLLFNTSVQGQLYGGGSDGAGDGETDIFWFWPGTFIMDAEANDFIELFGIPLSGGTNLPIMGADAASVLSFLSTIAQNAIAMDWVLPFIYYGFSESGQLLVYNQLYDIVGVGDDETQGIPGVMVVEGYTKGDYVDKEFAVPAPGELGLLFRTFGPVGEQLSISLWTLVWGYEISLADSLMQLAKAISWNPADDPLVLDLDGDGIETVSFSQSGVHFDMDGDFFAQKTGLLRADDGFLVADWSGNGKIDDISEMFGTPGGSGFAELALHDANTDGVIDAQDAVWSDLLVWRDLDQDGGTDQGELFTLASQGVVSIQSGMTTPVGTEVFGNQVLGQGSFTRADGSTGSVFEVVFGADQTDTIYRGEKGLAAWLDPAATPDAKGFGSMANLSVGMSNDLALAQAVRDATAQMTTPDLADFREKATPIFGLWSQTLDLTRELTPVQLTTGPDGVTLSDHAIWNEDAAGGWFTLASGNPVLGGGGVIDRPTMADILAQGTTAGQVWQLEQMFSPQSRDEPLTQREAAPYLVSLVNGRAVVLDYAIKQPEGHWALASGTAVTGPGGVIAAPSVADILAMGAAGAGQEWRIEALGHNPYANPEVSEIAVNIIDGLVVDYSVQITDIDGTFQVWARNLDRALELQSLTGRAADFNLRSYELDLASIDEVGSSDDSAYRIERITAGQLHYATSIYGIDFRPEIMRATTDPATGMLSYTVGSFRDDLAVALGDAASYDPAMIDQAIGLMDLVIDSYITVSRAFSVRLALQGGLSDFGDNLIYDVDADRLRATTDAELAPLFDNILAATPGGALAATEYLQGWHELLQLIYPDFDQTAQTDFFAATVKKDQSFIVHNLIPGWEAHQADLDLDLPAVLNALGLEQDKLVLHAPDATTVTGTDAAD